jgi:hypothetical protein
MMLYNTGKKAAESMMDYFQEIAKETKAEMSKYRL